MGRRVIKGISQDVVPTGRRKRRSSAEVQAEREFWRGKGEEGIEKKRLHNLANEELAQSLFPKLLEIKKERDEKEKEAARDLKRIREEYCERKGIPFPKEWEE